MKLFAASISAVLNTDDPRPALQVSRDLQGETAVNGGRWTVGKERLPQVKDEHPTTNIERPTSNGNGKAGNGFNRIANLALWEGLFGENNSPE